ncbi:alpha/beta fold hydrolase [Catellatospora sichuanensis]|uniref:alpha/beta fold hydrolase n=1 Tax=Catellatospora sichuanensis TaxID=1969805 RepID=UPI0016436036|nr:alpha/beta fold hydrolase [Catellatospora sichuanensis]
MTGHGERVGGLWLEVTGSGEPVVLLHGAGTDSRLWDGVVPALARRHTVIRYDGRGLGRSDDPTRPYRDVDDLRAVLDYVGVDRAALVGLSMGGEATLDFALAEPDRVTSLALVGTSVSGWDWPRTPELAAYDQARRDGDADLLATLELDIWAGLGSGSPGGALIERMVTDNARRRVGAEAYALFPDEDALPRLATIAVPTLVLWGVHDHPEIGVIARRLLAEMPGATGEPVPDGDHYLPLRTPGHLSELLLQHLA